MKVNNFVRLFSVSGDLVDWALFSQDQQLAEDITEHHYTMRRGNLIKRDGHTWDLWLKETTR